MFETILGLPVHALVVHAVVVLMPLAAVSVFVAALWPRFRRWAGMMPLILSVAATALVPVATQSGDWLALNLLGAMTDPAVGTHASLGRLMIRWGVALVVAAAAEYWLYLKTRNSDATKPPVAITIGIMVIAVVASVGVGVHVFRVGDSGARAVWEGRVPSG